MVKVAVITGGGSGIGEATAHLLASDGMAVALWDRNAAGARAVAEAIEAKGGQALALAVDVRDSGSIQAAVAAVDQRWGRVDVLVNNAGIVATGSIGDFSEASFDEVLGVNLKGVWLCTKYLLPLLRGSDGGTVVNVGSTAALVGFPDLSAYCASKGGVVQLTRALALELAPSIRVNCVCPGHIETPMGNGFIAAQADPELFKRQFAAQHPLGRLGRPEEIAAAIRFLASSESSFMTGAVLAADAGYTAR